MSAYKNEYARFANSPESFWGDNAKAIEWFKAPSEVLSKADDGADRWFADGVLNSCYLAVDYHVDNGRAQQLALIYDSPVTGVKQQFTYQQMQEEVGRLASVIQGYGLVKGDVAVIYMPMIPQAVFAMLACARLGVVHSVVFGGFAAHELAARIEGTQAAMILTASCGVEPNKTIAYKPLLDEALRTSQHKPSHVLLYQRPELLADLSQPYEHDWQEAVSRAEICPCVPVKATDPLYILYTSGSTGKPKGVVRDNGGHAVAMKYSMRAIYDCAPGDVFWAASDVGWVVGHSYIVYAPLINGCTTVLYEGKPVGTPDAGAFWRVVEEYRVNVLFSAPTAFRAIKKQDPDANLAKAYNLDSLQALFVAGERLDPATFSWLESHFDVPLIDHWWQTETAWAIAGNLKGVELLPAKTGSAGVPVPGYHVDSLDEQGTVLPRGEQGYIAIKLPLPPACLVTLWQSPKRFYAGYLEQFPGYYVSGDGGYIDDDGYVFVMGRMDDVINVAGHRLSTGRMEEVVGMHQDVAECAVVGVDDALKGQVPLGFIILKNGATLLEEDANTQIKKMLRDEVGAINCMKHIYVVSQLPKTRSGKILRRTLRQIANGEEYPVPSTIDDVNSLQVIEQALHG